MPPSLVPLPVWTNAELKEQRDVAEALFSRTRKEEGPRAFTEMYLRLRPEVESLLAATSDLRRITGDLFLENPGAWQVCRYVCAPPVSQEDLWTLVGASKFKTVPTHLADETAAVIRVVVDPVRFPWIDENRAPSSGERESAIMSTALLWASQQLGTERRGDASKRQELLAGETLAEAGMVRDPSGTPIRFLDDISRNAFSRERRVAGAKCDVPARLGDGRLLALECKVSNGPKNGWKRVVRETGGKAEGWRGAFGSQIATGVVLSGVFDLSCLLQGQDAGVTIFWEHDMNVLKEFVQAANR